VCSVLQAHERYGGGQASCLVHGQQEAQEAPVDGSVDVDIFSGSQFFSSMLNKEFAIPVVNKQQKVQFQKHIAMHSYATGSSFQRVEDVHLIVAIKTLRPDDGLLPNRRQLATSLLDTCHEDVKTKVAKGMIGAASFLISDGWSNVNNDAIIKYIAASPEFAMFLFLESVSTC
jgi:hypothetical protein